MCFNDCWALCSTITILTFQVRLGEVKKLSQGHTSRKWPSIKIQIQGHWVLEPQLYAPSAFLGQMENMFEDIVSEKTKAHRGEFKVIECLVIQHCWCLTLRQDIWVYQGRGEHTTEDFLVQAATGN